MLLALLPQVAVVVARQLTQTVLLVQQVELLSLATKEKTKWL
jgi:hypothetical protein